jgi:ParB-like chromosome segregation protein Spo0J
MAKKSKQSQEIDLTAPLSTLHWVDRNKLRANDYNPNRISRENLDLLVQSILSNGFTMPLVVRPDYTIIDGFHRWTVSGEEPLFTLLKGQVPVVVVKHADEAKDIYGTITHNRARGTHLLEPMKNIVRRLLAQGKTVKEVGKELGMKPEEIFRLSDLSKEQFLMMMAQRSEGYSKEVYLRKM